MREVDVNSLASKAQVLAVIAELAALRAVLAELGKQQVRGPAEAIGTAEMKILRLASLAQDDISFF
jgi:hypothetical protein